jgi:hypothetical protein
MIRALRYSSLILLLVSPLFSALLTDDLEVVVPTGLPGSHDLCLFSEFSGHTGPKITVRVIETPNGSMLLRQYSNQSFVPINLPDIYAKAKHKIIMINTPSALVCEGGKLNFNVILE